MREATQNEYHKAVNRVVDYINKHLKDAVDLQKLAGIANISEFHFHRVFKAFIGEPLGAYITRLRLENAAQKLRTTNQTLTRIAETTGYQTQYALSKAFKKHFGISPFAFRNMQSFFSSQFTQPEIKHLKLNPDIRVIEQIDIVYIRIIAKYGSPQEYDTAWKKLWQFAKQKEILNGLNEYIGLSFDDPNITKDNRCRFYACITTNKKIKTEGEFGMQSIEKGKYAVFTLKGPYSGLNDFYATIYLHWLPENNMILRDSLPFEKYLNNPDKVAEHELLTEIYIPVK